MGSKPKMAGLGVAGGGDTRISANNALKDWLAANGVWVSESSGWGIAPHPLSVAVSPPAGPCSPLTFIGHQAFSSSFGRITKRAAIGTLI